MDKIKKFFKTFFAGTTLVVISTSSVFASNLARVTATDVNLRAYNSTDAKILGKSTKGDTLTILANTNDGWFKINKAGVGESFINGEFISIYQTDATCISEDVNVRSGPSTSHSILGTAQKGQVFITNCKNADWYQVRFNGKTGYIFKDYMQGSLLEYLPVVDIQIPIVPVATLIDENVAQNIPNELLDVKNAEELETATIVITAESTTEITTEATTEATTNNVTTTAEQSTEATTSKQTTDATTEATTYDLNNIYGVVDVKTTLNLRSEPNSNAKVIKMLKANYYLTINSIDTEWVKVTDDNGDTGYVSKEFLLIKSGKKPVNQEIKPANEIKPGNSNVNVNELIAFSKKFIGTPYVWGGTNLNTGVDCSGFLYSVYGNFGIKLNRSSRDMYSNGTAVTKDNLAPGDLVFFNSGGNTVISHVGMYIGDGKYIHSTNGSANGVTISSMSDAYSVRTYVGARRIL